MTDRRRGLGKGLGALIPTAPAAGPSRPTDVFFAQRTTVELPEQAKGDGGQELPASALPEAESPSQPDGAEGLDALVPVPGASFAQIPVLQIRPNPRQPRQVFDEDDLDELTHSIRELGVLQPIVVRPLSPAEAGEEGDSESNGEGHRFELVMGERRWRASSAAGQDTIPAIVRETADEDLLRDALLENLHRAQLNPLEEAAAYHQLLGDFGCTQEELAGRIGRSRPQISNTLRLLKLPPLVQRRVASGVLSAGHARALLGLSDAAAMERLAQRIVAEGLSVRAVEEIVLLGGPEVPTTRQRSAARRDPDLEDAAAALADRLDTSVSIRMGQRRGKLTVDFASREDLDRILGLLSTRPSDL